MHITSPYQLALLAKQQRKKLKLSQKEVSSLVGLGQKTISAFENNPETVQLNTFFRILSALNLEISLSTKDLSNSSVHPWTEEW